MAALNYIPDAILAVGNSTSDTLVTLLAENVVAANKLNEIPKEFVICGSDQNGNIKVIQLGPDNQLIS